MSQTSAACGPWLSHITESMRNGLSRFVVKKHHAAHLHYDFRLEYAGVLISWAMRPGPCLDPTRRRPAVLVEDHAVNSRHFEGTFAEGRYGAGPVLVWDDGFWECEQDVSQALRCGHLRFRLHGLKLKGCWSWIRTGFQPSSGREIWDLIKDRDEEARSMWETDILLSQPRSVCTGRTLAEVAAGHPPYPEWQRTRMPSIRSKGNPSASNQLCLFPHDRDR